MTDPLRDRLHRHYETLDRPHDRLRDELIAALPPRAAHREAAAAQASPRPTRSPGPMLRYAAVLAVLAGLLGLIAWLSPGPVLADVVFADVLDQIRAATTVSYSTRLRLGDRPEQTARVQLTETGRERKTLSDGGVQISDFAAGRIVLLSPPAQQWALVIEYASEGGLEMAGPLQRLMALPNNAGRLLERRDLAGRSVCVFEVARDDQRMRVFADSDTRRPVRVEIVSRSGVQWVMTDFAWDEPIDEASLALRVPPTFTEYSFRLIDESRPIDEADLVATLEILADLADGAMPDSLDEPGLATILTQLEGARPDRVDLGTGTILMAGPADAVGEPAMVGAIRTDQRIRQVRRGLAFLQGLADGGEPFAYVGRGARRGGAERVFWYRPRGSAMYRVIYADSTVRDVRSKAAAQGEPARE